MTTTTIAADAESVSIRRSVPIWLLLWRDKPALIAFCWLMFIVACVIVGHPLFVDDATVVNLAARNAAPGFEHGLLNLLGADPLGRP